MKTFKFFSAILIALFFTSISIAQVQDFNLTAPAINPNPLEFPGVGTFEFSVNNVQGSYAAGCGTITIEMDKVIPIDGGNSVTSSIPNTKWSWSMVNGKLIGTQIAIVNEFLYSETITVAIQVSESSVEPGSNGFYATVSSGSCGDGNDTNNNASSITWTVDAPQSVPVEMVSFDVSKVKTNSLIEWTTASELNNSHFEIERSENGVEFEKIAEVNGNGNSNRTMKYRFIDENPFAGVNYYRLQQVDFDGRTTGSEIKSVKFNNLAVTDEYSIYPNPASEFINIKGITEGTKILVYNLSGSLILESDIFNSNRIFIGDLDVGMYIISAISSNGELMITERITIIK